ncbi:MAG: response regulator [Desulfobacterales bacterium]|nr:response regulator [Desulfobacterales bacterium]MBF0396758.1 response regulator [Desulfobacterales bacterium]
MDKGLIILIEDEYQMRRFLRITLQGHGYKVFEATTGQNGLTEVATRNPDVVLLDLGLPDIDGLEVTKRLREWTQLPIIIISARDQEDDKIKTLDAGADDYLTKPFGAGELMARIRVAMRHSSKQNSMIEESVFSISNLKVDLAKRQVFLNNKEVHLTPIEYKLFTVLIKHAGKVITHNMLMKEVWGASYVNQTHYLRIYMAQLRHKLEADPARPCFFINEPGIGYRFKIDID